MKNSTKTLLRILLVLPLLWWSAGCQKGDQGPAGKNGEPGPTGPQGPAGNNATSSVIHKTYSIQSWSSNNSRWYVDLSVPELTSDNINSSSVQVYVGTVANNWLAIPAVVVSSTNYFWGFLSSTGIVEVTWDYNGVGIGSSPNSYYGTNVQAKVVIIPATELVKRPNLDLTDYQAVKEAYNITE